MRFFRVFALHYISRAKKHTFWREKKRLRASKKNGVDANEETLERGRRQASRVPRRAMPSFARLFFRWWWWFFSSQKGARFCAAGCVNLKRKKKCFGTKNEKDERNAKERRPDDFIVVVVVPVNCSRRRRRRSSSYYGTSTHRRIQKSLLPLLLLILFPLVLTRRAPKKLRHRFVGASRLDQQKVRDVVGAFWTSTARRVDVFPRVVAP